MTVFGNGGSFETIEVKSDSGVIDIQVGDAVRIAIDDLLGANAI